MAADPKLGPRAEHADVDERAQDVEETEVDGLIQHARLLVRSRDFPEAARLLQRAQSIRPQGNVRDFLEKVESAARSMRY